MLVKHFSCGAPANDSELKATAYLKDRLLSNAGDDEWVILTNLAFSLNDRLQADEIDVVAIGPPGVRLIEVKHWTTDWINSNINLVEHEVDRVTLKARRIGTTLRKQLEKLPYVQGSILLTNESRGVMQSHAGNIRGVGIYKLKDWQSAIGLNDPKIISNLETRRLSQILEPRSSVSIDGSLRRLGGYVNLEILTSREERFHRIYKGVHSTRQDHVILHLYDLTASNEKDAERKARREFEALQKLQQYETVPRIMDSFQEAPGYANEMFFFTIVDPSAPSIEKRVDDLSWRPEDRFIFTGRAIEALQKLHKGSDPIIHRRLSPATILVKHDNTPILIGFELAKIPSDFSVGVAGTNESKWESTIAPEVRKANQSAADKRSDIFSMCASLSVLFAGRDDEQSQKALSFLERGLKTNPQDRATGADLINHFIIVEDKLPPPIPPARFWSEDQLILFRDHNYRIIARLGSGGIGTTYKVVETDRNTKEELGTYVAKIVHSKEIGEKVLRAYGLARSHLGRNSGLSAIYEIAKEWKENSFISLMTWIEGTPLSDFNGVFPLLAEDKGLSAEALALRWLYDICKALAVLHENGLIHGDVSPRNIIISGSDAVLTDYDFVVKIGESISEPGTILYCSPSFQQGRPATPSDDIYALAASFFHTVYDKEPFKYDMGQAKEQGLNWEGIDQGEYPILAAFLEKATKPDQYLRFQSAREAMTSLLSSSFEYDNSPKKDLDAIRRTKIESIPEEQTALTTLGIREESVTWLGNLLESYPGSRRGNKETRGLDTDFATLTYVDTQLEEKLIEDIYAHRVRLIILCGNAGDGKTALLQRIAVRLGFGDRKSSERILQHKLEDGTTIQINLDGSAACQGQSADEILDKFLAPFREGKPAEDAIHLLAVNDGRLLEWITNAGSSPLTDELFELLQGERLEQSSYIRLISLNQRSLVGGISQNRKSIETDFLDRLLNHLYGGDRAAIIWKPCITCSAKSRCEVFTGLRIFGPSNIPDKAPESVRQRARARLYEALQAVHLRGEVHITMRELRSALIYILFGIHFCTDYHSNTEIHALHYWDRAFSALSPQRQGEVLKELARFDPALESHPQIDRYLVSELGITDINSAPRYGPPLESARRRAFFEWTPDQIREVAGHRKAIGLARGNHLQLFRSLPLDNDEMSDSKRQGLCASICHGISRLEDLPPQALQRTGVPLLITQRTPAETYFWIEKPHNMFTIEADLPTNIEGISRLHRRVFLIYRSSEGHEERLSLGAELFHLLLELGEGYQLGDMSTEDTFTQLSIFVQRLIQEDERELFAWNPMKDDHIFRISAQIDYEATGVTQKLVLTTLQEETV